MEKEERKNKGKYEGLERAAWAMIAKAEGVVVSWSERDNRASCSPVHCVAVKAEADPCSVV